MIVDACGTNTPHQILRDANRYFTENKIKPFVISGALKNFAIINPDGTPFTRCPGASSFQGTPAPASAFSIKNKTFGWDSSLTLEPEDQFWNDGVGIGSPNIPNFVVTMANL